LDPFNLLFRSLIGSDLLANFQKENPQLIVEATERNGKHPFIKGLYGKQA
jgi:hypothetical protein